MNGGYLSRLTLAGIAIAAWTLVSATGAVAQNRSPQGGPPAFNPSGQHDRANIPPRYLPNPPGRGNPGGPSNPPGPSKLVADAAIMAVFAPDGTASDPGSAGARTFPLPVDTTMIELIVEGESARMEFLSARLAAANPGAAAEARALAASIQGLTAAPERLQEAIDSFNALIDASDAEWLANPPEEILAVRAALLALVEAADAAAKEAQQSDT